jgi:glucose/mannose-6-phosphate isomerase
MMDQLVARFSEQLRDAYDIGSKAAIKKHDKPINLVFVSGLGGSGIGANFVAEFIRDECKVPYNVSKSYTIPAYVGPNTLAIASSYSGNTEETLQSFEQMILTRAKVIVIASGGKLIKRAIELNLDYIKLPDDWPSPRACLGYSLVQQLFILEKLDLLNTSFSDQVLNAASLLDKEAASIREKARHIAPILMNKMPVIYTTDRMESVAVRFRQQLNENAKILCWHHVFPEMNHNELVGWRDSNKNLAVFIFRNKDDYERNQYRIDIVKEVFSQYTDTLVEVYSKGDNLLERAMYFVHLGDWISVELAALRKVDAIEVRVIDFLKSELGKM